MVQSVPNWSERSTARGPTCQAILGLVLGDHPLVQMSSFGLIGDDPIELIKTVENPKFGTLTELLENKCWQLCHVWPVYTHISYILKLCKSSQEAWFLKIACPPKPFIQTTQCFTLIIHHIRETLCNSNNVWMMTMIGFDEMQNGRDVMSLKSPMSTRDQYNPC